MPAAARLFGSGSIESTCAHLFLISALTRPTPKRKHTPHTGEGSAANVGGGGGKAVNREDRWTDLGLDALQPE
jgi:hypothetical protein